MDGGNPIAEERSSDMVVRFSIEISV